MKLQRNISTITAMFIAVLMVPLAVSAQPTQVDEMNTETQETGETTRQEKREALRVQNTDRREAAQGKLEAAKLKACQNRQETIKNILTRLSNRGEKQLDVFAKIADRTQTFYTDRGNVLDNYDSLVADVSVKQTAAEEAVANLLSTTQEFDCEGEDPKGVVDAFKEQLKARNIALKEYKTAVKNLIVGVKSVQSTEQTEDTQEGSQE